MCFLPTVLSLRGLCIIACLFYIRFVREEMEAYRLYTVVPFLLKFIDRLTNVYVRLNRKRLKGRGSAEQGSAAVPDVQWALSCLFHVLLTLCKAMAPFTPFFTENMFRNLRRAVPEQEEESVHFCRFPTSGRGLQLSELLPPALLPTLTAPVFLCWQSDLRIEQSVSRMTTVIDLARNIREKNSKPLKTPLRCPDCCSSPRRVASAHCVLCVWSER